ncbi:MAG: hypothetical protein Ct9H300mP1_37060 [Planctomycetaceae bacterium]|nr:MAG: hypothetical protein Ct9H300mP1_37060 [Planctomycetaceae bacterium]
MAVSGRETEPLLLVPEIRLAHSAISQLGSSSRSRPPSVYISGPPGTGKSHLARLFLQGDRGPSEWYSQASSPPNWLRPFPAKRHFRVPGSVPETRHTGLRGPAGTGRTD